MLLVNVLFPALMFNVMPLSHSLALKLKAESRTNISTESMDNVQQITTVENRVQATVLPKTSNAKDNGIRSKNSCELSVSKKSAETFSRLILKHQYDFVYLKLIFHNLTVREDSEKVTVIRYDNWVWTYKGENGGYRYLNFPFYFGYLSFGLLWYRTHVDPLPIEIIGHGDCSNVTAGKNADMMIGEALNTMTKYIAAVTDDYIASYWCYTKRVHLQSRALLFYCQNAICMAQTFEYSCCKYTANQVTEEGGVDCGHDHYKLDSLGWFLPIFVSLVLFFYYPLLLTAVGYKLSDGFKQNVEKGITDNQGIGSNDLAALDDESSEAFLDIKKNVDSCSQSSDNSKTLSTAIQASTSFQSQNFKIRLNPKPQKRHFILNTRPKYLHLSKKRKQGRKRDSSQIKKSNFELAPSFIVETRGELSDTSKQNDLATLNPTKSMNKLAQCDEDFICVEDHRLPVTFFSTIFEPIQNINFRRPTFFRLLRLMVIFIPLTLTACRIWLDYVYAGSFVKAVVDKGALIGFPSMIAGFESSRRHFLHIFGGPWVALPLYVCVGSILISVPKNLESCLEGGLIETEEHTLCPLFLCSKTKAILGSVEITDAKGFRRIHLVLYSQAIMLLNRVFWKETFRLYLLRWYYFKNWFLKERFFWTSSKLTLLASFILGIVYIHLCLLETILTCLCFACPVMGCFLIVLKAFLNHALVNFKHKAYRKVQASYLVGSVKALISFLILVTLLFIWYIYCLIFFDASWVLTKIIIFTYSGMIAYPRRSYGYIILTLMALYYVTECLKSFGATYQRLLELTFDAWNDVRKKRYQVFVDNEKRIPTALWEIVIERHCPRRVQVAYTIFKIFSIISILTISIKLLSSLGRFQQLSVIYDTFTALFICALPKLIKSLFSKNFQHRNRVTLRENIAKTVLAYMDGSIDKEKPCIYPIVERDPQDSLV